MDEKSCKVVVGLALENELYNGKLSQTLIDLFSRPNPRRIKALYDRLIVSENHLDRETAFWLEPALEQAQPKINTANLVVKMQEMEVLLFSLLWKVDSESQRDFNDWLNYIVNALESLRGGNWIDAKIFSSQAFQSSKRDSVNRNRRNPELTHQIDVLQRETLNCFEEMKEIPSKLEIPKERLEGLIEVQETLIELLQKCCLSRLEKESSGVVAYLIQRFSSAQRYLMRSDIKIDKAVQEISLASEFLRGQIEDTADAKLSEWLKRIEKRTKSLLTRHPPTG